MVTLPTYHICLICTAIESPPQGGLPPQGALPSPAKWPWYGLRTAVVKKSLRRVCTKFAMLIYGLTHFSENGVARLEICDFDIGPFKHISRQSEPRFE